MTKEYNNLIETEQAASNYNSISNNKIISIGMQKPKKLSLNDLSILEMAAIYSYLSHAEAFSTLAMLNKRFRTDFMEILLGESPYSSRLTRTFLEQRHASHITKWKNNFNNLSPIRDEISSLMAYCSNWFNNNQKMTLGIIAGCILGAILTFALGVYSDNYFVDNYMGSRSNQVGFKVLLGLFIAPCMIIGACLGGVSGRATVILLDVASKALTYLIEYIKLQLSKPKKDEFLLAIEKYAKATPQRKQITDLTSNDESDDNTVLLPSLTS